MLWGEVLGLQYIEGHCTSTRIRWLSEKAGCAAHCGGRSPNGVPWGSGWVGSGPKGGPSWKWVKSRRGFLAWRGIWAGRGVPYKDTIDTYMTPQGRAVETFLFSVRKNIFTCLRVSPFCEERSPWKHTHWVSQRISSASYCEVRSLDSNTLTVILHKNQMHFPRGRPYSMHFVLQGEIPLEPHAWNITVRWLWHWSPLNRTCLFTFYWVSQPVYLLANRDCIHSRHFSPVLDTLSYLHNRKVMFSLVSRISSLLMSTLTAYLARALR